jgi:hypothetical protein
MPIRPEESVQDGIAKLEKLGTPLTRVGATAQSGGVSS